MLVFIEEKNIQSEGIVRIDEARLAILFSLLQDVLTVSRVLRKINCIFAQN